MLPIALAIGSSLMAAKNAQDQRKDLRRQGDLDAMIESGKTAYSGFTGGPKGDINSMASGPSVMGNALSGGIAGFSQGQAFNQPNSEQDVQNAYAKLLAKQQAPANLAAAPSGAPQSQAMPMNAYSMMQGSLRTPSKLRPETAI